jgi:hypothetical protein
MVVLLQKVPPPLVVAMAGKALTVIVVEDVQLDGFVYVILVVPDAMPVTVPPLFIVPTAVLLLLQVPPAMELASVRVSPAHIAPPPVMAALEFTVTVALALQPDGEMVYVIIEVPLDTPDTTPVPETTVAAAVVPLVHAPPAGALVSVVVLPGHTVKVPDMGDIGFTVTVVTLRQPVGNI